MWKRSGKVERSKRQRGKERKERTLSEELKTKDDCIYIWYDRSGHWCDWKATEKVHGIIKQREVREVHTRNANTTAAMLWSTLLLPVLPIGVSLLGKLLVYRSGGWWLPIRLNNYLSHLHRGSTHRMEARQKFSLIFYLIIFNLSISFRARKFFQLQKLWLQCTGVARLYWIKTS